MRAILFASTDGRERPFVKLFLDREGSTTSCKSTKVPDGKGVVVVKGTTCIVVTNEAIGVCCEQLERAVYSYRNTEGRECTKD